jgi:endonuclease/exonuclease/phosphatase (EEP) superfamily protein YafD
MSAIPPLAGVVLRGAAFALALACLAAILLGQAGRWSASLDVFNHLEPLWLAGSVIALALWLTAGRPGWLTGAMAGAGVVVALFQMAPELIATRALTPPTPGAERLKIIQFNAWSRNADPPGTLRWILSQDADVVVLEEALGSADVVQGLRRAYPYRRTCNGRTYCEIEMFSKAPPIAWAGLMPDLGLPAAWAIYQGAGGPFTVVGMHAAWPFPVGLQRSQTDTLAKIIAGMSKDRMIVAGDFNSTPWSFALRRQDRLFGLERRTRKLASWPARAYHALKLQPPFPLLPIDHVYAGRGWRTVSVQRGPRLGSDHYPLIIVLQAQPAGAKAPS